jgi:hypothetical protein
MIDNQHHGDWADVVLVGEPMRVFDSGPTRSIEPHHTIALSFASDPENAAIAGGDYLLVKSAKLSRRHILIPKSPSQC